MGVLKISRFLLFFFSFGTALVHAKAIQNGFQPVMNSAQVVEEINRNAAAIQTIQSTFIQKKQLDFLDETIISKGAFWFKRENQLKWAYQEPFEYIIVIRDGIFRIKDGEQVSSFDIDSNPAFMEINNLIIGMVRGNITNDRFEMQVFENPVQYLVRLVPRDKNMKEVISTMEIYFDKADLNVAEVIMKENEKDYTIITFTDKKINEVIEDSVFSIDR